MVKFNQNESRAIYHRRLNDENLDISKWCTETTKLNKEVTNKGTLITTFEGDIIEYRGEIYLAHMMYAKIHYPIKKFFDREFEKERKLGLAVKFEDAIANIKSQYKQHDNILHPFELNFELKDNLSDKFLEKVVDKIQMSNLPHYYASFYGKNIERIQLIDKDARTVRHVFFSINNEGYNPFPFVGMTEPNVEPSLIAVGYSRSFGKPTELIYSPMNSKEQIINLMKQDHVRGIFTDLERF
jgi:hypothetical protein